jgi:pimeloyl-ACP methyl ester carboxylesterase
MRMNRQRRTFAILAILGSTFGGALGCSSGITRPALAVDLPPGYQAIPCGVPSLPADTQCATTEVFENRDAGTGRTITLRLAVVPALEPWHRLPDPLVMIGGGPGEAIVESGGASDPEVAVLRLRRDLLLVDYRGTGGSSPLPCTELSGDAGIEQFLNEFLPAAEVRACRERLEQTADLAFYNADMAVDDLAEVATDLGLTELNLIGYSYGTRVTQVFLRRHPGLVRTATLFGVLPTGGRVPLPLARDTQNAIDDLFALCAADADCHAAFPHPEKDLRKILKQAEQAPVEVDFDTGEPELVHLVLNRDAIAQMVRYMSYSAIGQSYLPLALRLAAEGDLSLMLEFGYYIGQSFVEGVEGLYLSVTCAEDVPFIQEKEIKKAVRKTFVGDFRIRRQIAACAEWPEMALPLSFLDPVVSDVPVLAFSGSLDPTTPPANGEEVVSHLTRGRHLVMPGAGHGAPVGMQGAGCVADLVTAFVNAGAAEGLDASCLANLQKPPFVTGF